MKIHFNHTARLFTGCLLLLSCAAGSLLAQNNNMGVGTSTPDVSAILEVKSATKGLLIPRMEPNIFPTATSTGLLFYNKGDKVLNYWDGTWRPVGLWKLNTTGEKAYYSAGNVGIGTNDPDRPLTVQGVGASMDLFSMKNTSGVTKWHLNMYDGSGLNFAETGVADGRLFLKAGGNVGIGTLNPQQKLSVIGLVRGAVDVAETEYTEIGHSGSHGFINTVGDGNLDFRHNNTTLMSLTESGNVGIGISPGIKFQVEGGTDAEPNGGGFIMAGSLTGANVVFDNNEIMARNNGATSDLLLNNDGGNISLCNNGGGSVSIGPGSANGYRLSVRHDNLALRLQNVGAGSNYWELWQSNVAGDAYRLELWNTNDKVGHFNYNSGNYSGTSDSRLKENVISLGAVLPSVLQLQAKKYTYKSDPNKELNIGFMAQDVEKLFPELVTPPSVTEKGETPYMMFHAGFGMIAIKAIQEQQAIIEAQAAKIEAQQAKLEAIEKALLKAGIKLD